MNTAGGEVQQARRWERRAAVAPCFAYPTGWASLLPSIRLASDEIGIWKRSPPGNPCRTGYFIGWR
jgi:hypothetical protein